MIFWLAGLWILSVVIAYNIGYSNGVWHENQKGHTG